MTIQNYVNNVLLVPVSRIGNKQVVEAIELYLDERNHKFLPRLSEVTGKTISALDNSLREAKRLSISNMDEKMKEKIFSTCENSITITQFIIFAANYYKENYENKEEG